MAIGVPDPLPHPRSGSFDPAAGSEPLRQMAATNPGQLSGIHRQVHKPACRKVLAGCRNFWAECHGATRASWNSRA